MNVFLKTLSTIIDRGFFVSLFTDLYDESFNGYVICMSDDLLLLNSYELSKQNGIKILRLDDITRIRWGSKELEEIESLITPQNNSENINSINIDNKKQAIEDIQKLFGYVTIHVQSLNKNICFIGEVIDIDDETIILHEFGVFGSKEQSYLLLALQDITRIDVNGIYEKQLIELYRHEETEK